MQRVNNYVVDTDYGWERNECPSCDGLGKEICVYCEGVGCTLCDNKGTVTCDCCDGAGKFIIPKRII